VLAEVSRADTQGSCREQPEATKVARPPGSPSRWDRIAEPRGPVLRPGSRCRSPSPRTTSLFVVDCGQLHVISSSSVSGALQRTRAARPRRSPPPAERSRPNDIESTQACHEASTYVHSQRPTLPQVSRPSELSMRHAGCWQRCRLSSSKIRTLIVWTEPDVVHGAGTVRYDGPWKRLVQGVTPDPVALGSLDETSPATCTLTVASLDGRAVLAFPR